MIAKADFMKSPHIGVFCIANDDVCFAPLNCPDSLEAIIKEVLGTDIVKTSMAQTALLGIFSALNNKTMIVSDILDSKEVKKIKEHVSEVVVVDAKYTAVGNLIAMNGRGIACPKILSKAVKDSVSLKVAGSDLIGSSVFVNSKGFLAHRDASEEEVKILEKVFKVQGDVGTVNMGDPFVKSGIIGNKRGIITGAFTSGPELNRIDDVFILGKE